MNDELLLIEGISRKRYQKLREAGLDTMDKILQTDPKILIDLLGMEKNPSAIDDLIFKINLYKTRKLYVKKDISLPNPKDVVFFDIEASAYKHNIFLVSFIEQENEPVSIYNSKRKVFEEKIIDYLQTHLTKVFVSSSGNHFDKKYLVKPLKERRLWPKQFDEIEFIDLMAYLKPRLITPVGFSVKKLSHLFGYEDYESQLVNDPLVQSLMKKLRIRQNKDSLGYLFALAYDRRILNGEIWRKMIEYNVYDVEALKFIYSKLYDLVDGFEPNNFVNF